MQKTADRPQATLVAAAMGHFAGFRVARWLQSQHRRPRGDPGRRRPVPVPGATPLPRAGRGG